MISSHARPLALALAPAGLWIRAVLVVLGSALIALAAQLAIPLPGSPVPVNGQQVGSLVHDVREVGLVSAAVSRM